jgi:UDP-2,3-diacylglucosamine pyrophosphatase LpxH
MLGFHRAKTKSAVAPGRPDDGFNYLLLSDVHLGSDIVPHLRPWALTTWLLEEPEVDSRLVSLLAHYRRERDPLRPWRLIIAGDFLDLVGVSLAAPREAMRTPPTPEEERHGLGSAPDHVVRKVRAIADRHPRVFRALMQFVADGHSLVIVRGNHDIELYWRSAQKSLIEAIVQHARPGERARLASRIAIRPWFFAVEGLLYVEHGHEFDAMCSYGDPLSSICARDPRRIRWTPFSVLLRYVARPTRGVSSASYGYAGMAAYVQLLAKLGVLGSLRIAGRYARASYRLLGECILNARQGGQRRAQAARLRVGRFAKRMGISEERLSKLRGLYVLPGVQRLGFMLRSLYLDRVACGVLALGCLLAAALLFGLSRPWPALPCALSGALLLGYAFVGSGSNQSPQASMRRGAAHIAALFAARWVVMGHTHEPVLEPLSPAASYVNLGSWGEDDPPDERKELRTNVFGTFLVLRHVEGDYRAEFLRWEADQRPVPAVYAQQPAPDAPAPGPAPAALSDNRKLG